MAKAKTKWDHEFPVRIRGFSVQGKTAKLGVVIDSAKATTIHKLFRNSQIQVSLTGDPESDGDTEGQTKMVDTSVKFDAIVDVRGYSVSSNSSFSIGLLLSKDVAKHADGVLQTIAFTSGTMCCTRLGDAVADSGAQGDDETDE